MRVDETEIIAPLMGDPRFAAFYAAEREKAGALSWYIAPQLIPEYGLAAVHWYANGPERVRVALAYMPTIAFAEHIAHEICHPILWRAGYPYLQANEPKAAPMANYLANIVQDLRIYDILASYGFPRTPLTLGATEKKLFKIIRKVGYSSPKKMEAAYREVLRTLNYTKLMRIIHLV